MKLKEIADISTGYSFRSKINHDPNGNIKVIQMSDVDRHQGILVENLQRLANFKPRSDRYFLKPGDVIMISKGYNMDAFVVPEGIGQAVAANSFVTLSVNNSLMSPNFLAWLLNSTRSQHYFKELAAGTNIPSLSIKASEALEVRGCDHDQQRVQYGCICCSRRDRTSRCRK